MRCSRRIGAHNTKQQPPADVPDDAPDERVPMLDDVVAGGLSLDESPLSERTVIDVVQGGLDDDLFQALLTDAWKDSAAAMLKTAAQISNNTGQSGHPLIRMR